ncbi:MAG: LLM class flavin-dependent oxidoreductase [Janthinobacterium lividum]
MELGISSFGEVTPAHVPGGDHTAALRMQELVALGRQADTAGLDVVAIGEHHRADYVVSAPEVVLGAIAAVTQHVRLTSAVTVLSSTDPVRTFQNFATLDLLSNGRAEIIAGRGSFIESFPLFGQDLKDYDELYAEKLGLLLQLNQQEVITWKGKYRPALAGKGVYPRPAQLRLPIWIGVGGTPASAARAGSLGLGLTIAILGGAPSQYATFATIFRQAAQQAGHDAKTLPLCINCHFHLAASAKQAADEFFPAYSLVMNRIGRERGWPPMTRAQFDQLCGPEGPLFVGTPEQITNKLLYLKRVFNNTRFIGQLMLEGMPHEAVLNSINLFGQQVAPALKAALSQRAEPTLVKS